MDIQKIGSTQTFGNKIIVKGSRKQVAQTFALIALSDKIWPKHIGDDWNIWSLNTKGRLFKRLKLIVTGKEDEAELKKYQSTLKIPRSGLVSNEEFNEFAQNIQILNASKVLKAIKLKKFDFAELKILA